MSLEDKYADQAQGYKAVDDFDALPLSGPGRWAEIPGGTLYTNDANVLFLRGDGSVTASAVFQRLDQAYKAGATAAEAFDSLKGEAAVVTGDLSELAE